MYRVEVEVIWMPTWARAQNLPDLADGPDFVWLKDRTLAYMLMHRDQDEGGHPKLDRFEAKRCPVCKMLRLGELSRHRRRIDESALDGRKLPCSPECMTRYHQQRGTAA